MAADNPNPGYSALLIGSWECDRSRKSRDSTNRKPDEKGGIKKGYKKDDVEVPQGQWAVGDLDNMERLMRLKNIGVFYRLNYVEQYESGHFAGGKDDILKLIDAFFKQDDKTHFILYFTGHGARKDGSWCFARRAPIQEGAENKCSHGSEKGDKGPVHTEEDSGATNGASNIIGPASEERSRAPPNKKLNDFVEFDEVISKWDENKRGREDRFLMMILDCCHAGKWVHMLNEAIDDRAENAAAATPEQEHVQMKRRDDICIQASCRPVEKSEVASNQQSSVFTRAFVAAQNRSTSEKRFRSFCDHMFVLNIFNFYSFTPLSSKNAPLHFCGIIFFDSFNDMHLKT